MNITKTWNKATATHWIAEMEEHQRLDRLRQGAWFDKVTLIGCFFGCATQSSEGTLEKAIAEMKLPPWLVYLAEGIFEGLSVDEAKTFPVRLLKAIPLNADIESVKHKLAIARLSKLKENCRSYTVKSAMDMVIKCHESPDNADWSAAESVSYLAANNASSAAWFAARSTASSAEICSKQKPAKSAHSAAYSVLESAESAAESAAGSTRSAAGPTRSARSVAWSAESTLLIKLLSEIKDQQEVSAT